MGDPIWVKEESLSDAEKWEARAREQLLRAQEAEKALKAAREEIYGLKRRVPQAGGTTPEDAARNFAAEQWPGEEVTHVSAQLDEEGPGFRVRCRVDGTSMKIDGYRLNGACLVTSWC